MKTVSMYTLKQELASIIAETESGADILVTRHNRPVARITRPETEHLHRGAQYGRANLRSAVRKNTGGRYLHILAEDRRSDPD